MACGVWEGAWDGTWEGVWEGVWEVGVGLRRLLTKGSTVARRGRGAVAGVPTLLRAALPF